MAGIKVLGLLLVFLLLVSIISAGKGKKRRARRCKYDKRGAAWSPCDPTLQVKTKVANLVRGRSSCPKTRTYTKPCDDGSILLDGCKYIQVSDWSDCDPVTQTTTRTLELQLGDNKVCDNNRVESKECGKEGCEYETDEWSECDLRTGLQTLVQTLKADANNENNSTVKCEQRVVSTRACISVQDEELRNSKKSRGKKRRKKKKNRDERKRQRKKKKKKGNEKKDKKKNKKKKDKEDLSKEPPRLTELLVVPYTTFAVVSWAPPEPDAFGEPTPVDKYHIGYGLGFPDLNTVSVNGTEVTHRIENLEPGRQYIVSIRAENSMGAGQPLYETIMTREPDAGGASSTVVLPPIGVRATVLSSEAINVSWVDMKGEAESRTREYHLRYNQLNRVSSSSSYRFKMLRTSDSHMVVKDLQPYTQYEFAVRTADGGKNSSWSMMVWNTTLEAAPSTSPEDLTVILDPDSPGNVILSWQPPSKSNGIITNYDVLYSTTNSDGQSVTETEEVDGTKLSVTLTSLIPGLTYDFSVKAKTSKGVGPPISISDYLLPGDNSESKMPKNVKCEATSSTSISVTMDHNPSGNIPYVISYQAVGTSEPPMQAYCSANENKSVQHCVISNLTPSTNYSVMVQFYSVKGASDVTDKVFVQTLKDDNSLPEVPKNVKCEATSSTSISVTMDHKPSGKIPYVIFYKVVGTSGPPNQAFCSVNENKLVQHCVISNLTPSTNYSVMVQSYSVRGASELTEKIIVQTLKDDSASVPATLRASPSANDPTAVTLTWDIPEEVTMDIIGFVILYTSDIDSEHMQWAVESRLGKDLKTAVIDNLQPGTKYYFKMQARTSEGYGPESNTVLYETPYDEEELSPIEAPNNLKANVLSATSAVLSWQDPGLAQIFKEDVVLPDSSYTVRYRSLDPEPSEYTLISPPFTSLYLVDLLPLTRYEFSVKVRRGDQQSEWSLPVENTTFAADFSQYPLKAEVRGQKQSPQVAILSWQPHSDSKIKEYVVMYSSDRRKPHKQWIQKAAVNQDIKQQVFYNLKPETTYFFFIQAMTDLGFGPRSKVVSYTTPKEEKVSPNLTQPKNLQVIVMSANSAVVSWQDLDLAKGKEKESEKANIPRTYTLRYRDLSEKSLGYKFAAPTFPSIFMVDLQPATQYEFSVRIDKGDHHSEWSSPVVNSTFEAAPSSPPLNVSVTMDGGDPTTALLTWKPPKFPNGEITGYLVFYKTSSQSGSTTVAGGDLSHRIPLLKPQTNYFFQVGAKNSKGFSPLSARVAYRTPRVIGTPPTDVTVVPSSDDPYNAVINWQPPDPSKRKIKYYTITHYTEEGKHHTVQRVQGSTLTTVVKKLLPSTTYHFTVQAHYRRGGGPHSDVVKYSIPKEILQTT